VVVVGSVGVGGGVGGVWGWGGGGGGGGAAAALAWNNATRGRGSGLAGKCLGGGSDEVDGRHASCPELYHPFTTAIHHPIFPLSKHNQSTHEL